MPSESSSDKANVSHVLSKDPLYFDYNATTPLDPAVAKAMADILQNTTKAHPGRKETLFGNPSSSHIYGTDAKLKLELCRMTIQSLVAASISEEIIFTSGGSESINHAIQGSAFYNLKHKTGRNIIVTSAVEHVAVKSTVDFLVSAFNFKSIEVGVDECGIINLDEFSQVVAENADEICIVSVMLANNETGAVMPINKLVKIVKDADPGIIVHTDASQAVGKIMVNVRELGVDLLTVAAHKMYGPKGIGALFINQVVKFKLESFIHGASHEFGQRAGTENVLLSTGFAKAAEIFMQGGQSEINYMAYLRGLLQSHIVSEIKNHNNDDNKTCTIEYKVNGPENDHQKLPNTLSISFKKANAAKLMEVLASSVACSAGSACHSNSAGNPEKYSSVLKAMNLDPEFATGTLRLSVGRFTQKEDVVACAEKVVDAVYQCVAQSTRSKVVEVIPPTRKLYFLDSYNFCSIAKVLSVTKVPPDTKNKMKLDMETEYWSFAFDQTLFHPQGGGQPNDQGYIVVNLENPAESTILEVVQLFVEQGVVFHVVSDASSKVDFASLVHENVQLTVCEKSRRHHARLHSAGHLIDVAVARLDSLKHLIASKGCHFPSLSYVEYKGQIDNTMKEELRKELQDAVDEVMKENQITKMFFVSGGAAETLDGINSLSVGDLENLVTKGDAVEINQSPAPFAVSEKALDPDNMRVLFVGNAIGCPCGGTHVKSASEIGQINITKVQYKKKITKVTYNLVNNPE